MALVTVYTGLTPANAHLVRSRLEAAGFHPVIQHELSSLSIEGYAMAAGGILVQVPATESEEAAAFIRQSEAPEPGS